MSDPDQRAFLDAEPPEWVEAARGLADATRALVEAVGLTAVDTATVEDARAEVERLTAALGGRTRPHPLRNRPPGSGAAGAEEGDGSVDGFTSRPTSAFHPVLPMSWDGERLTSTWTASAAHEGPPGHLHGGVSAWHLDALLGTVANLIATPAVTSTLEVRYRRPVPVGVPLDLVAEPVGRGGRRIVVEGRIAAAGETCVEGRGTFVRLDRGRPSRGAEA